MITEELREKIAKTPQLRNKQEDNLSELQMPFEFREIYTLKELGMSLTDWREKLNNEERGQYMAMVTIYSEIESARQMQRDIDSLQEKSRQDIKDGKTP